MRKIFALGEAILDIIFENDQPVAAKPGGAMLNAAVSLGRCGIKVEMITELSEDHTGRIILDFLKKNGVGTKHTIPYPDGHTPVSLAFLDENKNAQYTFFKNYPSERLTQPFPEVNDGDIVLFGSFYSLAPEIRGKLFPFVKKAKEKGALIIYDPNIRKNHLLEIRNLFHLVEENIRIADIVRASDEDLENLFGTGDLQENSFKLMKLGCQHLVVTRGKEGVDLLFPDGKSHFDVPVIDPVSTIGAGDAFNAGLIFCLSKMNMTRESLKDLTGSAWKEILSMGIRFATDTCLSMDNYISWELAEEVKREQ